MNSENAIGLLLNDLVILFNNGEAYLRIVY